MPLPGERLVAGLPDLPGAFGMTNTVRNFGQKVKLRRE
jgi:hypothetical protein